MLCVAFFQVYIVENGKSRKTLAHRVIIGKVSSASFYRIVS